MTGDGVVPVKVGEGRVSSNRCGVPSSKNTNAGRGRLPEHPHVYVNDIQTAFVCLFVILFV